MERFSAGRWDWRACPHWRRSDARRPRWSAAQQNSARERGCVLGNSGAAVATVFETIGDGGAAGEKGLAVALVVIGGHSRNVGKTSVVAGLIAALAGIAVDRGEDHAIWPRNLFGERRSVRLRYGRPLLGDHRGAGPQRPVRHLAFSCGGSGASFLGAHGTGSAGGSHAQPCDSAWQRRGT